MTDKKKPDEFDRDEWLREEMQNDERMIHEQNRIAREEEDE